jgi:hypothetical protein
MAVFPAFLWENSAGYFRPVGNPVYEIFMGAGPAGDCLQGLPGAHRLVQALLKGELSGRYELLDFLIWPGGLLARLSPRAAFSLPDLLDFLKEQSSPSGRGAAGLWDDRLQRIRLVPPGDLSASQRGFLQAAERIRALSPGLFFLYQNQARSPR